jgi:hypothetical protein
MDFFVLLAVVVCVVGLMLAVYGRFRNTTGGLTDRPDATRADHPGDDGHERFEQIADDGGSR